MGKGKGALRIAIEDFIETYGLGDKISSFIRGKAEGIHVELFEAYDDFLDQMGVQDALPPMLRPGSPVPVVAAIVAAVPFFLGVFVAAGMQLMGAAIAPISQTIALAVSKSVKHWRPDPSMLTALVQRFPEQSALWIEVWDELGIPENMLTEIPQVLIPKVPEGELITLWYRHDEMRSDIEHELSARGWTEQRIEKLVLSRKLIPGINDLISMAVREAWNEETVERFEYDADFPTQVVDFAAQQGMDEQWVRYFWRAHWQLPSISAGNEMYHRLRPGQTENVFDIDDLRTLLRTADIPTFFRERLIEVSRPPYTRVDLRRMYGQGTLTYEQMIDGYRDLGYDDEKATALSDFAVSLQGQENRDLTKAMITGAYKRKVFSRQAAIDALVGIGFRTEDAELALALIDYDLSRGKIDDDIDRVKFLYMEGEIDEGAVYTELGHLNLPAEQIAELIISWEVSRRKKRALPSRGDLEDFYRRDLITIDELRDGLTKRRYISEDIDLYIQRLDLRVADEAAKEAERAQKEQDRIEASELKTEYQRSKAELDVLISNANLAIADIKISMAQVTARPETKTQLAYASKIISERTKLKYKNRQAGLQIERIPFEQETARLELAPAEASIRIEELEALEFDLIEGIEKNDEVISGMDADLQRIAGGSEYMALAIQLTEARFYIREVRDEKAMIKLEAIS